MSRRRAVRRPRRVQVHFWRQGEPTAYVGYTTNLSTTGTFVATNSPMAPGTRVRLEVIERERGFMVEGVVAHARKIRGDLARVSQSGMGVRFLSVEELVRELLPATHGQTEEIPTPPPPSPPPAAPAPFVPEPSPPPLPPPSFAPPLSPPAPVDGSGGSFIVRFGTVEEFLEVYRRDISQGGLFVSTRYPGKLQETVVVEIHPPWPAAEPVVTRARVVQRFDPGSDPNYPNLLAGMGLELMDLAVLVAKLQPLVRQMQG